MKKFLTLVVVFTATLFGVAYQSGPIQHVAQPPHAQKQQSLPATEHKPRQPAITNARPSYLPYPQIVEQLKEWNKGAPDFTEIGTYGKSSRGQDLYFLRVTNRLSTVPKKKVMITACIHGNEPLATSTTMWFIGVMLSTYGSDKDITDLLNTRDVYFVPVVSPDSYPQSRHVDGVDPNRDFPGPYDWNHRSVPPIKAVGDFMALHRFNAAISGHTFGRVILMPYGDKMAASPNDADYQRVIGKMGQMAGYRIDYAHNMYKMPIRGSDIDFYFRNGAFSVVVEYGDHQRIPSQQDIQTEFDKTYRAVMYFIREAPLVNVQRER